MSQQKRRVFRREFKLQVLREVAAEPQRKHLFMELLRQELAERPTAERAL
jgi:hypothetical protein